MSWLQDLVSKKKSASTTSIGEHNTEKRVLYVSIDYTVVRFLLVDEAVTPRKILSWKEVDTGPYEDLGVGLPVRDIFNVVSKIITAESEYFKDVKDISVSLPTTGVFFKTLEVPKMEPANMQKAVLADIRTTLPIDFSQILFAQNDLGEKHENMKTYFCVMIRKILLKK